MPEDNCVTGLKFCFQARCHDPAKPSLAGVMVCFLSRMTAPFIITGLLFFLRTTAFASDQLPPTLVFNPITIQLGSTGRHTLAPGEIAKIAAGSNDTSGITNLVVQPATFTFCDVPQSSLTLTLTDAWGNTTNRTGPIQVLAPAPPQQVYVDSSFGLVCRPVGFPGETGPARHFVGFDAFGTIQAAVDCVAPNGTVNIAAGTYAEDVTIQKPLSLLGPNAGLPGAYSARRSEAKIIPLHSDPENRPIISVESDGIVIDGLLLDGHNPALSGGYNANGVMVHAAAGVQNGLYPDLADVQAITICNNIVTNISYDGICLDRYQYFGTSSAWNYIRDNKLANMWEGILTYALDSVIENNVISNATRGLSVHCVTTAAPAGFTPSVSSNAISFGQWWPAEIQLARAPGIWINFRREKASPLLVRGNTLATPIQPPALKTVLGFYALTIDGNATVQLTENTILGYTNCNIGIFCASCGRAKAVSIERSSLNDIHNTGVLIDTFDPTWGAGNCFARLSDLGITLAPAAVGVLAVQQPGTPLQSAGVEIEGHSRITGGACGVQVSGTNAWASVVGTGQIICGNDVGIDIDAGRALLEGNILTNNQTVGIQVQNGGLLDAGDCSGSNVTGLGTGSGLNGGSSGLNDLSGYGCDNAPPWAIRNTGTIPAFADRNLFGPQPGESVSGAISGPVHFSQAGTLTLAPPPGLEVECIGQVPPGATNLEQFVGAGGGITLGAVVTLNFHDTIFTNRPGQYTVTRLYLASGGCGQEASAVQFIIARDTQPPVLLCSGNIIQAVDPGCDYATVTFTNLAMDSCGEMLGPWDPVTTGRFPIGTNTLIVVATDLANNTSICSFDVAVIGLPIITRQPLSRTNSAGTAASFKVVAVSASPMSFQWKQNGAPLTDGGRISGALTSELSLGGVNPTDAARYNVDVANLAGTVSSSNAWLTVLGEPPNLRILDFSEGTALLELTGPAGKRFSVLTSTNLAQWLGVQTNIAPFTLVHTNTPRASWRFFRATPEP